MDQNIPQTPEPDHDAEQRYKEARKQLRSDCVEVYGPAHPNPKVLEHWCPISKAYHDRVATKITTIHPLQTFRLGGAAAESRAEAVFGPGVVKELMSPANCMILATRIKEVFDEHRIALVPDVQDLSDAEQMAAWYSTEPQEYRIRVFSPGHEGMDNYVPRRDVTFADLDGDKVVWKTDARPSPRFLWWHYGCCVLKESREALSPNEFMARPGRKYWAPLARWVKNERCLTGAVKILGQGYEPLFIPHDTSANEVRTDGSPTMQATDESIQNVISQWAEVDLGDEEEYEII